MESARFVQIHRIDIVEEEVRLVADVQIGQVKAQAIVLVPYDGPARARMMGAFMIQSVGEEYEERLREWLRGVSAEQAECLKKAKGAHPHA